MPQRPYAPESLTVLIIDDHDPIRKAIRRVVVSMGFGTQIECTDAEDADRYLASQPVDLVILDLVLKKKSGHDFLKEFRSRDFGSDIPVVIVTGEGSKEEIVRGVHLGANEYLVKPFQADALEAKLDKVMTDHHSPTPLLRVLRGADRYMALKKHKEALSLFEKALEMDPSSARASHSRAIALEHMGEVESSVKILEENIQKNGTFYKSYAALADILLKKGNAVRAMDALQSELELNPKQPNRQVILGKLFVDLGNFDQAIKHFREAIKDEPKHREALSLLVQSFEASGNIDKALQYAARMRRYAPTDRQPLLDIVDICVRAKDPKRAEQLLKDERIHNPDRLDAYIVLGRFLIDHGKNHAAAQKVARDALQRSPDHPEALLILAETQLQNKEFEPALASVEKALSKAESLPGMVLKAECLAGLKKEDDALLLLMKAIARDPSAAKSYVVLADSLKGFGCPAQAHLTYRLASRKGGTDADTRGPIEETKSTVMSRRKSPKTTAPKLAS